MVFENVWNPTCELLSQDSKLSCGLEKRVTRVLKMRRNGAVRIKALHECSKGYTLKQF